MATIALGLGIRTMLDATWTGPAGDTLYAVLIYLLVAILVPRKSKVVVAVLAMTVCVLIELFQLTGIPAELGQLWSPLRLVLGSGFGWVDLAAYALGCAAAWTGDRFIGAVVRARRPGMSRRRSSGKKMHNSPHRSTIV